MLAGQQVYAFTALKLRLEFDWLRLWGGAWGKKARKNASQMAIEGETFLFENWVKIGREMRLKEWRGGALLPVEGLTREAITMRTKWNAENRRVFDIRTVTNREGAAFEVLKYITKVADFCDSSEAVETFCDASKGARLIQTFGTWYGVKLDAPLDAAKPKDWGEMRCSCGCNDWKRMGIFTFADVFMDSSGQWRLRDPFNPNSAGSKTRPTIRALAGREE
jgi:hypothetical protein